GELMIRKRSTSLRGFKKDFPDALVVKLEQNYRSTARIVRGALGVIAPSREREPKELWTGNEEGAHIDVVACANERDEAAHVIKTIEGARARGVSLREMAVFYRIHAQSRVLEEAMRSVNMPYQIVGGTKFYERAEIKDALSYLRILVNPRSDVDLLRIINSPPRGIGATTLERLVSFASERDIPVHDALWVLDEAREIASAAQRKLVAVRELLNKLRAKVEHDLPSSVLLDVLEATGYREALRTENNAESDARLENLAELVGSIRDFEAEMSAAGEASTLAGFLERISLQSDVDQMKDEPRVTMMTVHGAKGLEFETVLLTGMEEEMFPYRGMDPGGEEEMEEERRLAYVAITRARHQLVLTHTATRQIFGTTRWGRPSRFIRDLPSDVVLHKGTKAVGSTPSARFIDRPSAARELTPMPWHQARPVSAREPVREPPRDAGERFVDREFFSDDSADQSEESLRRGSRVLHDRFGEGEVRSVMSLGEPAVVAFFPGWGEKKVLARFLRKG
ncbi:MAG: 3'-5' exonuclease, partial [Polyangiaceae bacterium]